MVNQVDSTSTGSAVNCPPLGPAKAKAGLVRRFLELIRFSHTIFALPFAALACVFAAVVPRTFELSAALWCSRLFGVLMCMVTARSAAMAFNRLVDARIDASNPRTAKRHIPAGDLSSRQVWVFFSAASGLFILACLLFLPNWLPVAFSVPVLVWICGYSFAKRFTSAAHLWLGVALALSPVCAWVALRGEMVISDLSDLSPAVCLGIAIAFWVSGFDIIYACQDAEFDRSQKLHSVPARFGVAGALRIAAGLHIVMLLVLCLLPSFSELRLGWLYWSALSGVATLVITQHALVSAKDLGRVNVAFFQVNAVLSFGFCLLTAVDSWLG
jgi:4-hydroxybenzoate polyprenyltransferase